MTHPAEYLSSACFQASTLAELFRCRVTETPSKTAYTEFDRVQQQWQSYSWQDIQQQVIRWQQALLQTGVQSGDRIAIMLRNGLAWIGFDQAALSLGLVTVPLYVDDRPDNIAYILNASGCRLLLLENARQAKRLQDQGLDEALIIWRMDEAEQWLPAVAEGQTLLAQETEPDALASIVYTSGTTGKPKGVMLSQRNFLSNVRSILQHVAVFETDSLLSFLPLSHALERTVGYYLPMMSGAEVIYSRSVQQLASDLQQMRPTALISVPRIYEQVFGRIQQQLSKKSALAQRLFQLTLDIGWQRFEYQQGRSGWRPGLLLWSLLAKLVATPVLSRLGGRIRLAVCGGAALPPDIGKFFISLGLPVVQGYGLTEHSPVICANNLADNIPTSIGCVLPDIAMRLGDLQELQVYSDSVMMGYWQNPEATASVMTEDGWLRTGDVVHKDERGHLYVTGRIKDIIVMSNGEKVPPGDMEMAIAGDSLFSQVMLVGEGRPYLCALLVLNEEQWQSLATEHQLNPKDPASLLDKNLLKTVLRRIKERSSAFPGYAQVRRVQLLTHPWTIESGCLTPTMKLKRPQIIKQHSEQIEAMYSEL